jgi:hypothetical protein
MPAEDATHACRDVVLGWHFIRQEAKLGYGDGREVRPSTTLSVGVQPRLWHGGLHCSERVIDALRYAPSSKLSRVAVWGDLDCATDKCCGRYRHVFWLVDIENLLWRWLCDSAEMRLDQEPELQRSPDPRSRDALTARREWLRGGHVDLASARSAAFEAARERGTIAAWEAAWVTVEDSAWRTARSSALRQVTNDAELRLRSRLDANLERLVIESARDQQVWRPDRIRDVQMLGEGPV